MICMSCGRHVQDIRQDYCPYCGANVLVQRKIDYLSKLYYNRGLEKAQVRDLSGAISCLKQSLLFNKDNIQARNLLGLVYFETGEVVAALSEWVISKNLQPRRNLAGDYIQRLQANPTRLDAINDTIRKYNEALVLARQHQEDMAAVKLKKVLVQNPKLIKGYHLLALIQMKNHEYAKARKILRKAARIDQSNTTTLRFLQEIDEKLGSTRQHAQVNRGFFVNRLTIPEDDDSLLEPSNVVSQVAEPGRGSLFIMLALGIVVGAAAFWMLAVPGIKQRIYREANRQIVKYSESVSSQGAELTRLLSQARENGTTANAIGVQYVIEKHRSESYRYLFDAYLALAREDYDTAALSIQQVYEDTLTDDMKAIYNIIVSTTGVSGITTASSMVGDDELDGFLSGYNLSAGQGLEGSGDETAGQATPQNQAPSDEASDTYDIEDSYLQEEYEDDYDEEDEYEYEDYEDYEYGYEEDEY